MNTREQAEQTLRDWAANNARRDEVVLAALRAGVEKTRIQQLTRIARTTINRIEENAVKNTVAAIVAETGATEADVLALVDQLVGLDGSEKVVASEEGGIVTLTADAAEAVRDQLES